MLNQNMGVLHPPPDIINTECFYYERSIVFVQWFCGLKFEALSLGAVSLGLGPKASSRTRLSLLLSLLRNRALPHQ
jgi:hypothetical protein